MSQCYVIDTGYLDELFRVDGRFEEEATQRIKAKFNAATEAAAHFVVPVPVIFEFANHIAQVAHAENRRKLSGYLKDAIQRSLSDGIPWHITPCDNNILFERLSDALIKSTTVFVEQFALQQIGLTDTLVSLAATSYKQKHPSKRVHIWTRDAALKPFEPDREIDPFV